MTPGGPRSAHRPGQLAAALSLLLLGACSGTSGTSDPPAPDAPTRIAIVSAGTFDDLMVTWTPPPQPVDSFELEMRMETSAYQKLAGDLPGNSIGAMVTLVPTVPELVTLYGRVRALKGSVASANSEEASYFRGLRAPTGPVATVEDSEKMRVTWTQPSRAAVQVQVERALYDDATSAFGPYTVVATLPGSAVTWLDASGLAPARGYRYRLRNTATYQGQTVESLDVSVVASGRPSVAPPVDLAASLVSGVPSLTWTNRSAFATSIRIERAGGWVDATATFYPAATLAADTTSWSDTVGAGSYTYRVVAMADLATGASSPVQVTVPPTGFDLSVLQLPTSSYVTPDEGGRWWTASAVATHLTLWKPVAGGWSSHALDPAGMKFGHPGVALDAAGRPHLIYVEDVLPATVPAPTDIVHEWYDGNAWQREIIARRTLDSNGAYELQLWLAFDLGGSPHVVWKNLGGGFPEHAHRARTDTIWTIEPLASTLYDPTLAFSVAGFGAGPDGTLYLLVDGWNGGEQLLLGTKPDGLAWSEEVVPTTGALGNSGPRLLMPCQGGVSVAFARWVFPDAAPYKVMHLAKAGATWGSEAELASYSSSFSGQQWVGASIGTRVALLVPEPDPEGLWLYAWDQVAGWTTTRLRQSTGWDPKWMGFTQAGKIWVLTQAFPGPATADETIGALRSYLLYTEP